MKPVRTFKVRPSLPSGLLPLLEIAHNLRWSWDHAAIQLFLRLDRDLWERCGHNPVLLLELWIKPQWKRQPAMILSWHT